MANPKYEGVDRYALGVFKGMHDRVREGFVPGIDWPRTREGYLAFCIEIGRPPAGMRKPWAARISGARGYEAGNVRWVEGDQRNLRRKDRKEKAK